MVSHQVCALVVGFWRGGEGGMSCSVSSLCYAMHPRIVFDWIVQWSHTSIVMHILIHVHPSTSFTAETFSLCLSRLRAPFSPILIVLITLTLNLPSLEGCWCALPRRARADWQIFK